MLFLLQIDPSGAHGFLGKKKHMENLGLGYLARYQLGLQAEMKEMGRMAPSLSSEGGKLALASQLAVLPLPCQFN